MANDPQFLNDILFNNSPVNIPERIDERDLGKSIRSKNLSTGAEPQLKTYKSGDFNRQHDWRVKLSLPNSGPYRQSYTLGADIDSQILSELVKTDGFVFPYTPQVFITQSANYEKLSPTHSNYPFPIYENSQVDQFTITGDFTVENASEGRYWIAANHYLRSVTKMDYGGKSSFSGTPPPVVYLNGYGDFIFKDVPVVVEQYQLTLPQDVDYIRVPVGSQNGSWVPAQSNIAVSLSVAYSRDRVNKFSLKSFVKGDYIFNSNSAGFI